MSSSVAYCFAVFAIILVRTTIVSVRGQCTTEGCENGDPSMRTVAETQQMSVEAFRQLGAVLTSLQAIDQRRLQEHYIYIEQGLSVTRLLNESFRDMKNQFASVVTSLHAVNRRLQEHDISIKNHNAWKLANGACGPTSEVCDCSDIKANGQNASGVYVVCAGRQRDRICTDAFCDMETANRASLVCQRRKDGSVNFYRTWAEYREGFGDSNVEFWLGNEMLHLLTSKRNYKLRIDLEDWEGNKRFAEYGRFSIGSSVNNYTLTVGGYSGDAVNNLLIEIDELHQEQARIIARIQDLKRKRGCDESDDVQARKISSDSLNVHNGQQFSTRDADNDKWNGSISCAVTYRGAWWYNSCHHSNLNGIYHRGNYSGSAEYGEGVQWNTWPGRWYSLKSTEMKLVPTA